MTALDVLDVPRDAFQHRAHFAAGLADRLAHLARRELRELVGLGCEQVGKARSASARSSYGRARPARAARAAARSTFCAISPSSVTATCAAMRRRTGSGSRSSERRRGLTVGHGATPARPDRTGPRRRSVDGSRQPAPRRVRRRAASPSALPSAPGAVRAGARSPRVVEPLQRCFDIVERTERVPPFGALLQLARRLRAAQQQHAEQRELRHRQLQRLIDDVAVLHDPLTRRAHSPAQVLLTQRFERALHRRLVVLTPPDRGSSSGCTR